MTRKDMIKRLERVCKSAKSGGVARDKVNDMVLLVVPIEGSDAPDSELCEQEVAAIIADLTDIKHLLDRISEQAYRALAKTARRMADEAA